MSSPTVGLTGCKAKDDFFLASNGTAVTAIYYPFVVWVCGVLIFFLLRRIPRLSVIPYAALMFLLGTAIGVGAELRGDNNLLGISIHQWIRIDGNLLLLVFLPGLIFRDAIEIDWDLFICSMSQLLILAFPMVLVGTGLVAAVCIYTLPSYYNFNWALGATLGSILSSTDPVAVTAVLREAGAPPRLQMQIGGESMLNDGSAMVFYTIFSRIYLDSFLDDSEPMGWAEGIKLFFQASLGGLAMGIAFALGLVVLLYELDRRLDPEYSILQVVAAVSAAYISYFTADLCGMSGVLSCLFCGIGSARMGRGLINDTKMMDAYLKLMEHMLNSLLFALGGSIWGGIIASRETITVASPNDWAHLVAFFLLVNLIRFFQVALFYPILCQVGLKSNIREATFLAFGGLRGAVGIALAASLFRNVQQHTCDDESATRLVFLSGGISLGTLLINGTAAGWVLQKLGLALPDKGKTIKNVFDVEMRDFAEQEYQKLISQKRFSDVVDFDIVNAHVTMLTRRPAGSAVDVSTTSSIVSHRVSGTVGRHQTSIARIASTRNTPDQVVQLRLVFLDILGESYGHAVARGELVLAGGDRALDVSAYRYSVEFAESDAKEGVLSDWKALQMFSITHDDAISFMRQRFVRDNVVSHDGQKHDHAKYKKKRGRLLRAFCFVLAHERAQKRLDAYVESALGETSSSDNEEVLDNDALQLALKEILDESNAEVEEARAVIEAIPADDQRIILSHYAATIILNRLIKEVEAAYRDGPHADEARSYVDKIDRECLPNHHMDGYVCECLIEHSRRQQEQDVDNIEVKAKV
jgi:NhaP-type Na+/H+ or K+/H+ antiporter